MVSVKQDIVAEKQISVRDIALITAAVAFALSYAAKAGPDGHKLLLVHTCIVVALAAFVGIAFRRVLDAFFWGGLTTLLAFIALVGGEIPPSLSICVGWGFVAATCGAYCGVCERKHIAIGVISSCIIAAVIMSISIYTGEGVISQLASFDVLCAGVIGGLLWPTIIYLRWLVNEKNLKRYVLAAWLTLAISIGNLLVPMVA